MPSRRITPAYSNWAWRSAVHVPSAKRRRLLVLQAVENARLPHFRFGGLLLHCEGGYGYDRDLRRLVREGYLTMVRVPYARNWARDLSNPAALCRTVLRPTEKAYALADAALA